VPTGSVGRRSPSCAPLLDDEIVAAVRAGGGIDAIAISHPHFYSTMVE
jgi:hypothetical protein